MSSTTRTRRDTLWLLTIAPTIWALHLLSSYISAAVWCAKFARPAAPLDGIRTAIAWYTVVALAAIAAVGWEGLRRHRLAFTERSDAEAQSNNPDFGPGVSAPQRSVPSGTEATTHDLDTPEDQHRFLGFATLLLAGLSAVAVLYAALAAVFFDTCG